MNLLKFIAKVEIGCKAFKFKISGTTHEYTEDSKRKTSIIFNQPEGIEDFKKEDYGELLKLIETKLLEEYEVFKKNTKSTVWNQPSRTRVFDVVVMPYKGGKILIDVKKG